ncbi:MAG TPA: ATP-binding protein [Gemmatimonadales bacterium]|nr:ATP-binding protein [Gemmatimonadales bacterium]
MTASDPGLRDNDLRFREDELKAALSLLTATLESTADGILVLDGEGRITSYNSKYARMWRVPDEVLESRDAHRLQQFVSEQLQDRAGFEAKLLNLAGRPDAESFDLLTFQDGRVYERYSQPQRIAGRVVGRVFSFRDVSEQTRAARIQAATYRIAAAANTAPDLGSLLSLIHEIVGGLMPAKNFYVAMYDGATGTLSFPYFADEYDTVEPRPLRKGLTEYVLRTGGALLATPEIHEQLERRGEVELIGVPSVDWLGVPLRVHDRTIGVLVAQSYTAGVRYGETEQHILQFVSNQVALAIERRRAEERLQASEHHYRLLFESNPEAMWVHDRETLRMLAVNQAALTRYGYSRPEFLALTSLDLDPEDGGRTGRATIPGTALHRRKDGTLIDVEVSADDMEFEGRPARLVLARDVTERRQLEDQLRHSQKMEAVGRLAGGVAHDFNNLLTAILGYCQLLERELHEHPVRTDVIEVRRAAERAASLTQQLLAFSRKQVLQVQPVDLDGVVREVEQMLRRMIGEDLELVTVLPGHLAPVLADTNQLEQVIVNLAINARDAMPRGGRLTIATAAVGPDDAAARQHLGQQPDRYVRLEVTDTGTGMDSETMAHIFEPFFTTKGVGKGTGLGLAMVYGIVKQLGGSIHVDSRIGQGTSFRIYLPRAAAAAEAAPVRATPVPRGTETVLLVEDEDAVRGLAQRALESHGYHVLHARAGSEALAMRAGYSGRINLLLTDVIMPGMTGRELAERLIPRDEKMRVLYMSGYTDDARLRRGILERGTAYIQKPFTPDALARRVREVLDAQ